MILIFHLYLHCIFNFQVPNVIHACCDFLEKQLDPSNAIGIASFAEQHACMELCKKANQYIERHFSQVLFNIYTSF